MPKSNWFQTLNDALESEGLVDLWPLGLNIPYGTTVDHTSDDGTRYGHYISVYRDEQGRYERPIHYPRG